MNKGKDLLDFWSMVLKSIISSCEGTISCNIWKTKDKTQIGYFNVKAFEDFYLTKKSTGFRALGAFSSEKLCNLVHWCLDIKNGSLGPFCTSVTLLCDTVDKYLDGCWQTLHVANTALWRSSPNPYPVSPLVKAMSFSPKDSSGSPVHCSAHWISFWTYQTTSMIYLCFVRDSCLKPLLKCTQENFIQICCSFKV